MPATTCIACNEDIKAGAQLCRHCGTRQDDPVFTGSIEVTDQGHTSALAEPSQPAKRLSTKAWIAIAGGAVAVFGGSALAIALLQGPSVAEGLAMPGVGEQVARTSLAVGMCPNGVPERPVHDYATLPIVDCDEPHREEVFAAVAPTEISEWDAESLRRFAANTCAAEFAERFAVDAGDSTLTYSYYLPSEDDWASGYRAVACTVFDSRGPKTGLAEAPAPIGADTLEDTEIADDPAAPDETTAPPATPVNPPAGSAPAPAPPANPAPNNAQQQIEQERDRLLNEIQERNEQIERLADEKRNLVAQYENTYGPYSPNGPLYLNGDPSAEIALKQQIDDVESEIVILESDVLILFGQLNALPSP